LSGFERTAPQLSGGVKARRFAPAMALDHEILFFDLPPASTITAAGIDDLILNLESLRNEHRGGHPRLASTFLIADRIILIDRSNIAIGPVEVRNGSSPGPPVPRPHRGFLRMTGGPLKCTRKGSGNTMDATRNGLWSGSLSWSPGPCFSASWW
jgi:hypothetical protein